MNVRTRIAIVVGMAVAAGLGFYLFDPARWAFLPGCPLHALTGLHCPGCGSTRALHQLAHGNFMAAFALNPLAVGALPVLGFLALRGRAVALRPIWIWMLLGMICAFGILRNIPAYPFTMLAP
jgi:hypothetical protein